MLYETHPTVIFKSRVVKMNDKNTTEQQLQMQKNLSILFIY